MHISLSFALYIKKINTTASSYKDIQQQKRIWYTTALRQQNKGLDLNPQTMHHCSIFGLNVYQDPYNPMIRPSERMNMVGYHNKTRCACLIASDIQQTSICRKCILCLCPCKADKFREMSFGKRSRLIGKTNSKSWTVKATWTKNILVGNVPASD